MNGSKCGYCGAVNSEEEHRCSRCGRRVRPEGNRPLPEAVSASRSAAAPVLQPAPETQPTGPVSEPEPPARRIPYQPPLFRESPRVIPIQPPAAPASPRHVRARSSQTAHVPPQRRRRPALGDASPQQTFDFPLPAQAAADGSAAAVRYCNAPVAVPVHRMIAAALDTSMILTAVGIFLVILHLLPGEIRLNRLTVPNYLVVAAAFTILYKLLWCLAGSDSPGMRWTRLRLLNFDGHEPTQLQRIQRMAGGCLSFSAAGLGLLWALVDEESLAWHDHISKTFPTPYGATAD